MALILCRVRSLSRSGPWVPRGLLFRPCYAIVDGSRVTACCHAYMHACTVLSTHLQTWTNATCTHVDMHACLHAHAEHHDNVNSQDFAQVCVPQDGELYMHTQYIHTHRYERILYQYSHWRANAARLMVLIFVAHLPPFWCIRPGTLSKSR